MVRVWRVIFVVSLGASLLLAPPTRAHASQTVSMGSIGGASAFSGETCIPYMSHYETGVALMTIHFTGAMSCSGGTGSPILLSGYTRLYSSSGSIEAEGSHYLASVNYGQSDGQFNLAVIGTQHRLRYHYEAGTIDGSIWTGSNIDCSGYGTNYLICDSYWVFTI